MAGRRRTQRVDPAERTPPDAEAAMEIAAHFLGTRPRTRRELELRLRRSGTADEMIATTLERLEALGLVDDVAFTRWWAEQRDRHSPRGRRMVEAELRQRGVPREVMEALRGEELAEPAVDADGLPTSEDERADAALDRHLRGRPVPADGKARQRIGMYLMRRGFDPEAARAAIRRRTLS
jgi:regulatory protein